MKIKFHIPDLNQKIEQFMRINTAKRNAIKVHTIRTGLSIRGLAMVNQTPHVDTGRLRASIDDTLNLNTKNTIEVEVGSDVEYAGEHEARYPFLKPAALEHRAEFIEGIQKIMGR